MDTFGKCENCFYYKGIKGTGQDTEVGFCFLHPPKVSGAALGLDIDSNFESWVDAIYESQYRPVVEYDDFCSRFRSKYEDRPIEVEKQA